MNNPKPSKSLEDVKEKSNEMFNEFFELYAYNTNDHPNCRYDIPEKGLDAFQENILDFIQKQINEAREEERKLIIKYMQIDNKYYEGSVLSADEWSDRWNSLLYDLKQSDMEK